jgi:hypothetical protein
MLSPALTLILQKTNSLQNEKAEDMISHHVFSDVERIGIEPITSTMPLLRSTK